jgi:DNA integrity scanning protein DisA with diadenylate cyclase activity
MDPKVRESIKELTLIDGAFVIREDGVVISAGRFLHAGAGKTAPMKGLGARHAAAAAISLHTNSVAVTVSESTGTVRIFSGGKPARSIRTFRPQIRIHKR